MGQLLISTTANSILVSPDPRYQVLCAALSAWQVDIGAENTQEEHVDLTTSARVTGDSAVTRRSLVTSRAISAILMAACMPMVRGAQGIKRSASIHGTVTQLETPMEH